MLLKPKSECACGCGCFGTVKKNGHVRSCGCRRCMGARNRRAGLRKQAKAAKLVGVPRSVLAPGNEEWYGGMLRIEVKSGQQVDLLLAAYREAVNSNEPAVVFIDPGLWMVSTEHLKSVLSGGVWELVKLEGRRARTVKTKFFTAEAQSERHRPVGDTRPFAFIAMPRGVSFGLVIFRDFDQVTDALRRNFEGWS